MRGFDSLLPLLTHEADNQRLYKFSGASVEVARQKGQAFRATLADQIQSLIDSPLILPVVRPVLPRALLKSLIKRLGKKYLTLHHDVLKNYYGRDLAADLSAFAEGYNESPQFMYGLNAIEVVSSHIPFSLGCSSLAFAPLHTVSGAPLLAYNHDFPETFGKNLYVQHTVPDSGLASLMLTYPTILGGIAGVNAAGLGMTINHAYATDLKPTAALPITWLLSECLSRCENVTSAVELILKTPVPNGSFLTLIDAQANRAVVEMSCTRKEVRTLDSRVACTFNFYREPVMKTHEVPFNGHTKGLMRWILGDRLVHQHNIGRENRFQQIFDHDKKYDEEAIHQLMSDHGETGVGSLETICRHDPRAMNTIASVMINPKSKSMKVIFGAACAGHYTNFTL